MAQKDKIQSFIDNLYQKENKKISKEDILSQVQKAKFAADVVVFFKELPDQEYDENSLINALNNVIHERGREDAIGGLLRMKAIS
jgi:hypothetical protein